MSERRYRILKTNSTIAEYASFLAYFFVALMVVTEWTVLRSIAALVCLLFAGLAYFTTSKQDRVSILGRNKVWPYMVILGALALSSGLFDAWTTWVLAVLLFSTILGATDFMWSKRLMSRGQS
jgi:hypothetical protein